MEPAIHRHFIDKLAFFNGLISGLALYPQVWSVLKHGSVAGISLTTFVIIMVNSVVWLIYAMHRGLLSLGIASILNALASAALVLAILFNSSAI